MIGQPRLSPEALAERRKKVRELFDYGLLIPEISQRLGMPRTLVYNDLHHATPGSQAGPKRQRRAATKPRKRARKRPDFFAFLRGK